MPPGRQTARHALRHDLETAHVRGIEVGKHRDSKATRSAVQIFTLLARNVGHIGLVALPTPPDMGVTGVLAT
ncbi:hypothetical protein GCM10009815_26130 [Nocardioides marmoribigeumensis]